MALDTDDLEPRAPKPQPVDLETLSIEELHAYIASMQAEIARVQAVIDTKEGHRNSAEAVFKK